MTWPSPRRNLGAGMRIPKSGTVFVSVKESDRARVLPSVKKLVELGFHDQGHGRQSCVL